MKRYAFIDVTNTTGSAKILGFKIDLKRLFDYLKYDRWSCSDVYWYSGRIRNKKNEKRRKNIEEIGYKINDKDTHFIKKVICFDAECPKCKETNTHKITKKKIPKANCDVELTVDCLELIDKDVEFLIFTGDGDFAYLVEKLIEKDVKVRIFSTNKQDENGDYRLSTRLKKILREHEGDQLFFIELNNIKNRINYQE